MATQHSSTRSDQVPETVAELFHQGGGPVNHPVTLHLQASYTYLSLGFISAVTLCLWKDELTPSKMSGVTLRVPGKPPQSWRRTRRRDLRAPASARTYPQLCDFLENRVLGAQVKLPEKTGKHLAGLSRPADAQAGPGGYLFERLTLEED
ncbi:ferritin light chain-like [Phyllostomus hastatus]|uniref:ferritin light chain-like n=1 Tax=Phyllostomus hastatus TaxID=9423 RepID=UPI001E682325|nr:ferritin light chain-like [Phyllostomus hastatus]